MSGGADYFAKLAARAIWERDLSTEQRRQLREQIRGLPPKEQLALITSAAMETYQEPVPMGATEPDPAKRARDYQEEMARYLGETIN